MRQFLTEFGGLGLKKRADFMHDGIVISLLDLADRPLDHCRWMKPSPIVSVLEIVHRKANASPDHIHNPNSSARKWLYLELKAAYEKRQDLDDPLGVVEQIYADFDYPPAMESLVRYMPLRPGDEPGEGALLRRWAAFLEREGDELRGNSPPR